MLSAEGSCRGTDWFYFLLAVLDAAHPTFLLKGGSPLLMTWSLWASCSWPRNPSEVTWLNNKPHSCSLPVCLSPFSIASDLIWPQSLPETLLLAAQTLIWISKLLMSACLLPVVGYLSAVLMTLGKCQEHDAGCFSRMSTSTKERSHTHYLLFLPVSFNPLPNLIFKTKAGGWNNTIITYMGLEI